MQFDYDVSIIKGIGKKTKEEFHRNPHPGCVQISASHEPHM